MNVTIRFGHIDDAIRITPIDKSTKVNVLNWKLHNQEIIVAEYQGQLVGYLRLELLWSKYPYIGLIIVPSPYQRQGIGKMLLAYLEEHLIKEGISNLYSSSQVDEAEPQQWHRHVGFKECGIIHAINEGNIGEIFFVKTLDAHRNG